jgi:hypothetical protein
MKAWAATSDELAMRDTLRHLVDRAMKKARVARRSTKLEVR